MVGFIIFLLIVGVIGYFYLSGDSKEVKQYCKGRTDEQKSVVRYFMNDGCLQKQMKDAEYDALVSDFISKQDVKKKALAKIGLDESELKEIDPVTFEGWKFGKDVTFAKPDDHRLWRSSAYQVSWLFFSSTQVYLYQYTKHFDKDDKKERTEEYFYKDITNFSTVSETVETPFWDKKKKKEVLSNVDTNEFALVVPGDKFFCAMKQNDETERAIQAMKAKLREKKTA